MVKGRGAQGGDHSNDKMANDKSGVGRIDKPGKGKEAQGSTDDYPAQRSFLRMGVTWIGGHSVFPVPAKPRYVSWPSIAHVMRNQ
jgi:hypothetical protein